MPLIWTALVFCAGILTASLVAVPALVWWIGPAAGVLLGGLYVLVLKLSRQGAAAGLVPVVRSTALLVVFALGAGRYRSSLPDPGDPGRILHEAGGPGRLVVRGLVDSDPVRDDRGLRFELQAEQVRSPGRVSRQEVHGRVLVRAPAEEIVHCGDRIVARGRLELPREDLNSSYRDFLAHRGIYTTLDASSVGVLEERAAFPVRAALYRWRGRALRVIYRLWPDPEASLLAGILLGVESGIPDPVREAFRLTGTTHIIAISGFNITIVAGLITSLLRKVCRPRGTVLGSILGIGLFTVLVGGDPAVVRAAVMGGCSLLAHQIGRRQHGVNALAVAALVMAVHDPLILWSISFQLSAAATLGLVLYAEPLQARLEHGLGRWLPSGVVEKVSRPFSEYVLFTLAAQAATLPLLVYHFHQVSLSSLLVNPLILPLQPGVMILGGTAVILGVVWLPLGRMAAPLVYPLIYLTIRLAEGFSGIPGGTLEFPGAGLTFVIVWYGLLLLVSLPAARLPQPGFLAAPASLYVGLTAAALLIWQSAFLAPDGRLHLTFLPVGTGTAVLIQGPAGERVLVNGGPSTSLLADQLGRELPPFSRRLDLLLVSSPLEAEIGGTAGIIGRYPPSRVLWLGGRSPSRAADLLRSRLSSAGIPVEEGEVGWKILGSGDLVLEVAAETTRGGTILVHYGSFRALLPAGLDQAGQTAVRGHPRGGPVSVYLLADHGRLESNPPDWIAALNPRLCVLSVAADDRNGLPDPALLEQLGGYSLLRTDQNGTISITTDGQQMWITVGALE